MTEFWSKMPGSSPANMVYAGEIYQKAGIADELGHETEREALNQIAEELEDGKTTVADAKRRVENIENPIY